MPQAVAVVFGNIALAATAGAGLATSAAAFSAATALGVIAGNALIVGGLTAASNFLAGALASRSGGINSPEVRGSVRQSVPFQRVIYGEARVGGALFFLDDSVPPYLVVGLLLSRRRCTFRQAYIGVAPVEFDGAGDIITSPWDTAGTAARLRMSFRDGDPDQAIDPILIAHKADLPSTFRQRGHSTFVYRAHYGSSVENFQELWGQVQIPNIQIDVYGATVHDPREASSIVDDEPSWPYRNTAALVQADWLRQPYGGRAPESKLRWDEIARAAEYDDEIVGMKDGSFQRRYTIDGVVTLNQDPASIMAQMLSANRGFICTNQGRMWVTSTPPEEPILTIDDSMLHGGFEFRHTDPKQQLVNKVRTRFVAPDREYQMADGPVRIDAAYVAANGQELEATVGLPFTLSDARAQRIADLFIEESQLQRSLTANLPMRLLGIYPGKAVKVESELFSFMNGTYKIIAVGISDDLRRLPVTLKEYDATLAGQWTPATDQADFTVADIEF